jgi:hypothetical protein
VIEDGNAWEIGTAVYGHSSSNLTSRTLTSSSTGSLLNLSGSAKVFISPIVDDLQLVQVYSSTSDLPSASSNHGRITHVHSEGSMFFSHGGSWIKLQNASSIGGIIEPIKETETAVSASTQSAFNVTHTVGNIAVYLNGSRLSDADWNSNSGGTTVTLTAAAVQNDIVTVVEYGIPFVSPYKSAIYTANGSSPFNTGNTVLTANYTQGKEAIYVNGVKYLSSTDYSTNTGGTTITFTSALSTNDKVELIEHGALANLQAFTDLTDTPSALGTAGQLVQVNSGANALEFAANTGITTGKSIAMAMIFGG